MSLSIEWVKDTLTKQTSQLLMRLTLYIQNSQLCVHLTFEQKPWPLNNFLHKEYSLKKDTRKFPF